MSITRPPAATNASRTANEVSLSAVHPKTFAPRTRSATRPNLLRYSGRRPGRRSSVTNRPRVCTGAPGCLTNGTTLNSASIRSAVNRVLT